MRLHYAIVFVRDMSQSVAFYRDTLGFEVRFETSHWTELDAGSATLALHLADAAAASTVAPGPEAPGSCRPGLEVDDLGAFHARMLEGGVTCLEEPRTVFGSRIALYADPDGLPVSVGEARHAS